MQITARAFCTAAMLAAGMLSANAQTVADVDSRLEMLFGDHAAYGVFFEELKRAVAEDDREAVAASVAYPLQTTIDGTAVEIEDAARFVAGYDRIVTPGVRKAVADQTYEMLFANSLGVMIGDGEIWFSAVGGDAGAVRITAINN